MGFGIALIGYGFVLLQDFGGGVFAALVLGYGFFLASRLHGNFLKAAIASLFMFPRGAVLLCDMFGLIDIKVMPVLDTATYLLDVLAWMFMTYFWLSAVIEIAHDNGAAKLENKARGRLVITILFQIFSVAVYLLNFVGALGGFAFMFASAQYVLNYFIIFVNIIFLHTCFVLITGEKQYERDKQEIATARANTIEKRYKEQQEVSKKLGKK